MQCYTTYCDHIMRFKLVTLETNYLKKIQEHIFFQVIYEKLYRTKFYYNLQYVMNQTLSDSYL